MRNRKGEPTFTSVCLERVSRWCHREKELRAQLIPWEFGGAKVGRRCRGIPERGGGSQRYAGGPHEHSAESLRSRIEGTSSGIWDVDRKPGQPHAYGETMVFLRSATRQRCVFSPLSSNTVLKLLAGEIRQVKETKRVWIWKEDVKPRFAADLSSTWTLNRIFKKAAGTNTLHLACLQVSNQQEPTLSLSFSYI